MSLMTVMRLFMYVPYAAFAVCACVFVLGAPIRVRAKAVWLMALLLCYSKFLVFRSLGGHAFYPVFPELLMWTWNLAYSGAVILATLAVPLCWWRSRTKMWLLPLVAWSLALFGLWNGVSAPDVREIALDYPNLPPELDGYRIVQVSDLHASSAARAWRTRAVVERVNALEADLVCLTGDLVDGEADVAGPFLEPLKDLRAKDGVWAVTGNHEYFYRQAGWTANFAQWRIPFLENACVFPRPGLALGGVNDFRVKDRAGRLHGPYPDVSRAFAAATNGEFRVLLQHQPRNAQANLAAHRVDLQLSGHTHGGIMPVLRGIVERHNAGFVRGLYSFGASWLYVNSGAGQWAGFPLRFLTPSEITLVTLRRAR